MSMNTTVFCFAPDLVDEGAAAALSRIQAVGIGGLSLASVYHDGRDIMPHNRTRKVRFHEDGRSFFRPRAEDFGAAGIQPLVSADVADSGPFERVVRDATDRGMEVHGWAVFLHNTSLGKANPDAVTRNIYDDPQFTSLCPANPHARDYCESLARAIIGAGVATVNAEGLHFLPLEHGYHHERYFLRIGPIDRFLLGLCFCKYCVASARSRGVDTAGLVSAVRRRIDRVLESSDSFDDRSDTTEELATLWDGEVVAYLASREQSVTDMVQRVADSVHAANGKLIFNDPAGALSRPASAPFRAPRNDSWRLGIDPVAVASKCDEVQILAYEPDPQAAISDATYYRGLLGQTTPLRVAIRPTWPDSETVEDLRQKLLGFESIGAAAVDFYHYNFMRLEDLDRLGGVLAQIGWRS